MTEDHQLTALRDDVVRAGQRLLEARREEPDHIVAHAMYAHDLKRAEQRLSTYLQHHQRRYG